MDGYPIASASASEAKLRTQVPVVQNIHKVHGLWKDKLFDAFASPEIQNMIQFVHRVHR